MAEAPTRPLGEGGETAGAAQRSALPARLLAAVIAGVVLFLGRRFLFGASAWSALQSAATVSFALVCVALLGWRIGRPLGVAGAAVVGGVAGALGVLLWHLVGWPTGE